MVIRRIFAAGVGVVLILACWLVGSSVLARFVTSRVTAVRVARVTFYSGMKYGHCAPATNASSSFPASSARIYDLVSFARWQGSQTVKTEWYTPDGTFYDALAVRDRNVKVFCSYLTVYGDEAATHTGWWQLRVTASNQVLKSRSFRILPIQPDPQRLIGPNVCRHGCVADLQAPGGYHVHMNFSTTRGLVHYLRWHPGIHIQTVIGRSG